MIVIIDYKMGNPRSVANMLKRAGHRSEVSADPGMIAAAEKLILPGVGAFDAGMDNLISMGLIEVLNKRVINEKTPILGICLGMQLFTKRSDEGILPGLGWINAETKRFALSKTGQNLKIPHMGWNTVVVKKNVRFLLELEKESRFYFVHSYHVVCEDAQDVASLTSHGYDFVSSIEYGNIIGVQFHPEKSHRFGMRLLKNFAELY